MEKTLYAAWREARAHRPAVVYMVYHDRDGSAGSLLAEAVTSAVPSSSLVRTSVQSGGLAAALAGVWDGTLFGSPEVAYVLGFDYLATTSGRADPNDSSWLKRLWRDPPGSALILSTASEKLDERRKITKAAMAAAHVVVVNAAKHGKGEWPRFIRELGMGLALTDEQWQAIALRADFTVGMVRMELEKLKTYAGGTGHVTDEAFAALSIPESEAGIFDVVRLTASGDWSRAYALYRRLPQDTTFALLALLARQYRLMARVQEESGMADAVLAKRVGVHPYAVKVAREQARQFGRAACARCLMELADVEYAVKSGRLHERAAVDLWYLQHLAAAAPERIGAGRFQ